MRNNTVGRQLNTRAMHFLAENMAQQTIQLSLIEAIAGTVLACGDADMVLTGSLSTGSGDAYSDIDLTMCCDGPTSRLRLQAAVAQCLQQHGRAIAQFPATHLQMPDLLIHFWDCQDTLVKIDILYLHESAASQPQQGLLLVGVPPFLASAPHAAGHAAPADPAFLEDTYNKFCGWIWYTHTKIARGEYWEADDSLNVMRAKGLLPMLQLAHGLPLEGYRHAEQRLSPPLLVRLAETRCDELAPTQLYRALFASCRFFAETVQLVSASHGDAWLTARLELMVDFVLRTTEPAHAASSRPGPKAR